MPIFTTYILIINGISILFLLVVLWRIFGYNKKNHLPESKYTKLFGFVTKEYIAGAYILMTVILTIFTIWFIV